MVLLVLLLVTVILAVYVVCKNINRIKGLPPGPTPWPVVGNLLNLPEQDLEFILLRWKKQYGPVFTLWIPFPTIIISDYEVMKKTVIRQGDVFIGRPSVAFAHILLGGQFGLLYERNDWIKSQRKFAIHALKELGMGKDIVKETISSQANIACLELAKKEGEPIYLKSILSPTIGNVVHQLLFGFTLESNDENIIWFQHVLQDVLDHFMDPKMFLLDVSPAFVHLDKIMDFGLESTKKANDQLLEYLRKIVEKRKQVIDYDDVPYNFVDAFLQEMHRKNKEGFNDEYTEHQLVVALWDLYSAGFESIIHTIQYGIFFMLNYPQTQIKLHEEIDRVLGKEKVVTMDDSRDLPYTCAFIQENYRLGYVLPINFLRETQEDIDICGFDIPKGTRVLPQVVTSQIDDCYFERPDYFYPERYLENGKFIKNDKILPFSVGKRACLGENMARMEVFLFFVTLLQKFEFKPETELPPALDCETRTFRAPKPFKVRAYSRV